MGVLHFQNGKKAVAGRKESRIWQLLWDWALLVTLWDENEYQVKHYCGMKPLAQFWIIHPAGDFPLEGYPALVESLVDGAFLPCVSLLMNCLPFSLKFSFDKSPPPQKKNNEVGPVHRGCHVNALLIYFHGSICDTLFKCLKQCDKVLGIGSHRYYKKSLIEKIFWWGTVWSRRW